MGTKIAHLTMAMSEIETTCCVTDFCPGGFHLLARVGNFILKIIILKTLDRGTNIKEFGPDEELEASVDPDGSLVPP